MQTEASRLSDKIAEEMGQFPDLDRLSATRLIQDIQYRFIVPYAVAWGAVCRFRENLRRQRDAYPA